jgi:hypothetical protein
MGQPAESDPVEQFIHKCNLEHFRNRLAHTTDEAQRRQLLRLLAEEEARQPPALATRPGAARSSFLR